MPVFLKYILLSFVFLIIGKLHAQSDTFRFKQLGVEDGLSQGSIYTFWQDHKGFMWIGTRDGLNKYDAQKFTIYRNDPQDSSSLSDNFIVSLFEDSKKRMWVGAYTGLNLYDHKTDKVRQVYLSDHQGQIENDCLISAIREDSKGQVWFASSQGLYWLGDHMQQPKLLFHSSFYSDHAIRSNLVQEVFEDSDGIIWIGTESDLIGARPIMDETEDISLEILYHFYPGDNKLNDYDVTTIKEIGEGEIWIGTNVGGITIFDKEKESFSYIKHDATDKSSLASNDVRSIYMDRDGGIWIGTFKGLNYISPTGKWRRFVSDEKNKESLSHDSVRGIFQDRKGTLWIGTYFGGVNILDQDLPPFENLVYSPYTNSISHNVVSSIIEEGQVGLWIGTEGGGLNYYDKVKRHFTHYKHRQSDPNSLSADNVKAIHIDQNGKLWVGTYNGGLNLMDGRSGRFIHFKYDPKKPNTVPHNNVYAIEEDKEGNLWIGTFGGGLGFMDKDDIGSFEVFKPGLDEKHKISSDRIRSMMIDSEDNLWVGTENGLNLRKSSEEKFSVYNFSKFNEHSISGDVVVSIFEDSKNRIWLGTYQNGLNLYDSDNDSFTRFTEREGLPGNNIFGITEDDNNNLWLSTNNGICKFNPDTQEIKSYGLEDGLAGNEFVLGSNLKMKDGKVAFGSFKGLTIFHPDSITPNNYVPPVALTDFKLFNRSVQPGEKGILDGHISETKEIVLKHNQNVFSVNFAVLNFLIPEKNQYAYRLDGFEHDWNFVSNPQATYTNLNAGTYNLLVKGANNDGIWNDVPTSLTIKVLPPPWKTWWAFTIYAIIILLTVYLLIRFIQVRSKLEHDLQIEHLEKEREREIHELKLNFFTNISHEFRTPLTLIMAPLEKVLVDNKLNNEARSLLETVKNNAGRLLRLVNQLMDFRKQESGNTQIKVSCQNLVHFLEEIMVTFKFYAQENKINLKFISERREILVYYDPDHIEKVVVNLLSNAFKYSHENGNITLSISCGPSSPKFPEGSAVIKVEDDGAGIPAENLESVFDRFYQVSDKYKHERGKENSSGIGLALAKGLVHLHGGEINATSAIVEGTGNNLTCFKVALPLGKKHFDADQLSVALDADNSSKVRNLAINALAAKSTSPHRLKELEGDLSIIDQKEKEEKPTIVVVEDNNEVRDMVVDSLKREYKVYPANNGLAGWELIQKKIPDLVITDVMMPQSDGIELLGKVKNDLRTNHIPVILLTARTSMDYMLTGLKEGGDDYITKPFHLEVLQLKIRNVLSGRECFRKKFIQEYLVQPTTEKEKSPENEFLKKVLGIIEENFGNDDFNVVVLSRELGISRPVLYRKLKQLTDLSVIELINQIKFKKAAQLLVEGEMTISEVAYTVGFNDPKYFGKSFKSHFGQSPTEYAASHQSKKDEISL